MISLRRTWRAAALAAVASLWSACSDQTPTQPNVAPAAVRTAASAGSLRRTPPNPEDVRAAIAVLGRHAPALMRVPTVVGVAVGASPEGKARIEIYRSHDDPTVAIPAVLENVPVTARVTGLFMALSDPTTRLRPAPTGYSVGHPAITAGTIGARVVDASGNVYALSNNHVLANSNSAAIGDPMLQPGPYDGGTLADQIGTLAAFYPIDFSTSGQNTMDAAIARSSTADLGNATPTDDGYGMPNGAIYGDADADGVFDDVAALLTLPVQKYGRTTKLTHGAITGINASVSICYEVLLGVFCIKSANFVGQLIIEPGAFSGGGDSGSLIVTDDDAKHPVALLFAGSSTQTIANRIDLVLNHFGVRIDGVNTPPPPPPTPVTDVAITSVTAPASILQGTTATISVSVRNAGNQNVGAFDVTLRDQTDGTTIGTLPVASLAAGASTTLDFAWNTASSALGEHVLAARHSLTDDNAANDQASATTTLVTVQVSDMHAGNLDGWADRSGNNRWAATVEVTVHDGTHTPLNGATVVGTWNPSGGLASDTCTTGEGGGNGTCIFLYPSIRNRASVSFTVTSVTMSGRTYQPAQNHDPDGSSNGTTVVVRRP